MNIAFDSIAQLGPMSKNRGIGNYADAQFRALIDLDRENRYFFLNVFDDADIFWREEKQGRIREFDFECVKDSAFFDAPGFREFYGELVRAFLRKNEIDVFYMTSPFDIHIPPYEKEWFEGVKTVATVYDIIPYVMRSHYFPGRHDIDWYMERIEMLRWVDRLLVISRSVKDDLVRYLKFDPERIDVIWGAPSEMFRETEVPEADEAALREKYHIDGRFVMCTGGDDERKNIAGLIEAYAMLPKALTERFQLVVVCKLQPASVERYSALAADHGVGDRVVLTNFVTYDELVQLYNLADLVAFPSVYEGFGLPVVEAWACGTGVVTSNNSSLVQIAGDAAIVVDPHSKKDIARGLREALEGDLAALAQRGRERIGMFTWQKVAQLTRDGIVAAAQGTGEMDKPEPEKRRIAFFTPLPPQQSGISDYSVDILEALAAWFDIDVYVDAGYAPKVSLPANVKILPAGEYEAARGDYAETVYQVGNSDYHVYMWPFIQRWGGLVVLHDYNMHGVAQSKALVADKRVEEYGRLLEEDLEPDVKDLVLASAGNWDALDRARTQYEINGFIVNHAHKIIVHSDEAKEKLLAKNIGRDVRRIRHYARIEPLEDPKQARAKLGVPEDAVLFSAFGHVHQTKRILPILHAFALLAQENDDVRLLLGGKMDSALKKDFDRTVAELRLKGKVRVTGFLDLDDFLRYMDATDICLNLRWPYNGETSGSLMRMMAKGKCIMVNDMGSFSEVPDDCCVKLPSVDTLSEQAEIKAIYEAMLRLYRDPGLRERISARARQYAESELDLRIVAEQYRDYILAEQQSAVTEALIVSLRDMAARIGMDARDIRRLAATLAYVKNGAAE